MRSVTTLPALVLGSLLIAACAGEEAMDEAAPSDMEVAAGDDLSCYVANGTRAEAQERPSPLRQAEFSAGGHEGLICYGAPSARGREIMGGLLAYGQPERIGANEPTTIHLTGPTTVAGVSLEAGSYSIYAIANEDEWQFFINSEWQRWGIPIDAAVRASEIASFTVTPEPTDEMVETLTFRFEPSDDGTMGDIVMEWERTRVKFHVHPG
jgi:outer membrane murein-binding lipoprotein Lpp